MCTALNSKEWGHCFGRTLDVQSAPPHEIVITGDGHLFNFLHFAKVKAAGRIMGCASVIDGFPLFFDGMNERGLCAAALDFPNCSYTGAPFENTVASFEVIPFILSSARNASEARELLSGININNEPFSENIPVTPLHWLVGDKTGSFVIESIDGNVRLYDNPVGVLTNAPEFPFHTARLSEISGLSDKVPVEALKSNKAKPYSRGFGSLGLPGDYTSSSRFLRAAFTERYCRVKMDKIERFFTVMESVKVPYGCVTSDSGEHSYTVYTCCMDTDGGKYYYLAYGEREYKTVDFSDFHINSSGIARFPL